MLKPSISDFNLGYIQWWCEEESLENHGNIIDILHYTIFPNHRRKRVNISKRKSHAHTSHINRLILVCFDLCRYTSSLNVDIEYDIMVLLYGLRHGHTLDEHARQLMDDHIIKTRLEKINLMFQSKLCVSHTIVLSLVVDKQCDKILPFIFSHQSTLMVVTSIFDIQKQLADNQPEKADFTGLTMGLSEPYFKQRFACHSIIST